MPLLLGIECLTVEKEWKSFCVEVFSQGMKEHQIEKYPRLVKTISLGIPLQPLHQQPLGLQTFKLCFLSNIETCINLERLYLNLLSIISLC